IVKLLLPQIAPKSPLKFVTCALFQRLQKEQQVTRGIEAKRQQVYVVGHGAIGVNSEPVRFRLPTKFASEPLRLWRVREYGVSVGATERYEIPSVADVMSGRTPNVFVLELHLWPVWNR